MRCPGLSLVLLAVLLAHAPLAAQTIEQRVSFKYILSGSGLRPSGVYSDPAHLAKVIDDTNETLDRWGWGYRLEMEPTEDVFGASQFYALSQSEFDTQLQETAKANPVQYHWRVDAINVYIVDSADFAGGAARIPHFEGTTNDVVMWVGSADSIYNDTRMIHELGHHNALWHVFETGGKGFAGDCPGDDCVADTQFDPELSCTVDFECTLGGNRECCCATKLVLLDQAAAVGNWTLQEKIDIRWNVMSYFGADDCVDAGFPFTYENMILTPDQLDRWADATRLYHGGEVTGFTFFVGGAPGTTQTGYSDAPYSTVLGAYQAADVLGPGHIVNVRGGNYAENLTLSAPVTLRATRGVATIGQ